MDKISAIIVAAGSGNRMETRLPKQFLKIAGQTILYRTLSVFGNNQNIAEIILVIAADYLKSEELQNSIPDQLKNRVKITQGGKSRQESVQNGLKQLDNEAKIVLVHDGVRPFVTNQIIAENVEECRNKGAVLTAIPVTDTLKLVDDGYVQETLDRNKIWRAQTPQTFKVSILQECFEKAKDEGIAATDEARIVEKYYKVYPIKGHKNNFKITHKEDLLRARALIKELQK